MAARGIEAPCDWLIARTGATPELIGVAIEMTQGPVVEALLERGFCVYAVNPKQLDWFRDRFTSPAPKDRAFEHGIPLGWHLQGDTCKRSVLIFRSCRNSTRRM